MLEAAAQVPAGRVFEPATKPAISAWIAEHIMKGEQKGTNVSDFHHSLRPLNSVGCVYISQWNVVVQVSSAAPCVLLLLSNKTL